MSMVKHKRGTSSTLDVQHEAELKALANKSDEILITVISHLPAMSNGLTPNAVSFIGH